MFLNGMPGGYSLQNAGVPTLFAGGGVPDDPKTLFIKHPFTVESPR